MHEATDTFVAQLSSGAERVVKKGEPFADSHELVVNDRKAQKANPDRHPLFRSLELDEEQVRTVSRRRKAD